MYILLRLIPLFIHSFIKMLCFEVPDNLPGRNFSHMLLVMEQFDFCHLGTNENAAL